MIDITQTLNRLLDPIKRRIYAMASRAVVNLISDGLKIQSLQVSALADETMDDVERFQQYGFTSHPLVGSEAIILCMGGSRSHPIAINVDDRRYRKKNLAAGEVALYDNLGNYIWIKQDGSIEIKASAKVKVDAPLCEVTGNVTVAGNLAVTGFVTALGGISTTPTPPTAGKINDDVGTLGNLRTIYNSHTHVENNIPGSTNVPTQQM